MKNVQRIEIDDEFIVVKKMMRGNHNAGAPLRVFRCQDRKETSSARIGITLSGEILHQLRWLKGHSVIVSVSLKTRRALLALNTEGNENARALQFGGKQYAGSSASIRVTVNNEETRALLPVQNKSEYIPAFSIENDSLLFDLDK